MNVVEHSTKCSVNPLISFVLVSYNQDAFIREAIEAALAQTYRPLEIIISDDCSSDRTYQVAEKIVAQYKGPHKIILSQNSQNVGICENLNRAFDLASGELLVVAAGDDISLPERTEKLAKLWQMHDVSAIQSNTIDIDESGNRIDSTIKRLSLPDRQLLKISDRNIERQICSNFYKISGCALCFSREVIREFGGLDSRLSFEDMVLVIRASSLKGVLFTDERLVMYRRHSSNFYNFDKKERKPTGADKMSALALRDREKNAMALFSQKKLRLEDAVKVLTYAQPSSQRSRSTLTTRLEHQISILDALSSWWELTLAAKVFWLAKMNFYGERTYLKWAVKRVMPKRFFYLRYSRREVSSIGI